MYLFIYPIYPWINSSENISREGKTLNLGYPLRRRQILRNMNMIDILFYIRLYFMFTANREGVPVFDNITEALQCVVEKCKEQV